MVDGRLVGVATTTVASVALADEPLMLQVVEDYRDRAVGVMGLLADG